MRENIYCELQADKVKEDLKQGNREDGRKLDEYRKIKVEKNISENANGSCRIFLGETRVSVGVKFELMTPYPDSPDAGTMMVGFEFLPLASPSFELGPPRIESIELSRVVDRGLRESKTIDFKKLCLEEGSKVFGVLVDGYIENDEGNLFDAASLASIIALANTKFPKLDSEYKFVKKEFAGMLKLNEKPIMMTFGKIYDKIIVDPNLSETIALDARLSIAVTEKNVISAMQKGLAGSFSKEEVLECIDLAFEKAKELRKLF